MKNLFKVICFATCVTLSSTAVLADSVDKLAKRAQNAADVLTDVATIPDKTIPRSLLKSSFCIATIPGVVRAGLIVGAKAGKGIVSCRVNGGWSNPSYLNIGGGSIGLQIGVDSTDLILVFVERRRTCKSV